MCGVINRVRRETYILTLKPPATLMGCRCFEEDSVKC